MNVRSTLVFVLRKTIAQRPRDILEMLPMTEPVTVPAEPQRSEVRRTQILAAAADCFRRHGFHGASIAQISKAAGMSAGHIYHYFDNKEAIIAAIVAQDLAQVLTLTAELRSARDVKGAMIARISDSVREHLDPRVAALRLEIVAEAARHPGIADIVRSADLQSRHSLAETLRSARQSAGHRDKDADTTALMEVIIAMFEGLLIRAVRNPDLDQGRVVHMFQSVVENLLTQPTEGARKRI
jgi:TetR/AcrR family transcriptional repressor of uid operon